MKSVASGPVVPEFPSLWPYMLAARGSAAGHFPFSAPCIRYFYFARIAIYLSAHLYNLRGKEVLVPAYHHGVEIEALVAAGALPVFYRVGPKWEVDTADIARLITPHTGAIYITHFAGFPGPSREARALADKHGIPMIEDCALSLFSLRGEVPLGTEGDASIFCLYKSLPVPNGGALVLNNAGYAPRADFTYSLLQPPLVTLGGQTVSLLLRNLELRGGAWGRAAKRGMRKLGKRAIASAGIERVAVGSDHFSPEHVNLGMSRLGSHIVSAQDAVRIRQVRRRNYRILTEELEGVCPPLIADLPRGVCPLFYPLEVPDKERVVRKLHARGIGAVNFWRYSHPGCDLSLFPDVEHLRATVMELPCHQDLSARKTREMARVVREVLRNS